MERDREEARMIDEERKGLTRAEETLGQLLERGCPICGSKSEFLIDQYRGWVVESTADLPLDETPDDYGVDISCGKCSNLVG